MEDAVGALGRWSRFLELNNFPCIRLETGVVVLGTQGRTEDCVGGKSASNSWNQKPAIHQGLRKISSRWKLSSANLMQMQAR